MLLKNFFRKNKKYNTQSALQNMTASQIVNLNPKSKFL